MKRLAVVACCVLSVFAPLTWYLSTPQPRRSCQPWARPQRVVLPLYRPEQADREALPELVRANNAFALDLYRTMHSAPGNFVVSPACLTAGLALLRAGARGKTAAEIERVLHLPGPFTDRAVAALVQDLNADGEQGVFQIRMADTVWVQHGSPLLDAYRATLREAFAIDEACWVDFKRHPTDAARIINAWVAGRTGGKIAGAVAPESIDDSTRLLLTSALYFRAEWTDKFVPVLTRDAPFRLTWLRSVVVPMMHSSGRIQGYCNGDTFQCLSLGCGQGEFALVVLLPRKVDGLVELEARLTPELLDALWPRLRAVREIKITLPRFQIRTRGSLKPVLQALGLSRAFSPVQADFSGVNGRPGGLFVQEAMHETFLDVNEDGIEAASAGLFVIPASDDEEVPPAVVVDHPFLYMIRDTRSGCIVFLGRVVDP